MAKKDNWTAEMHREALGRLQIAREKTQLEYDVLQMQNTDARAIAMKGSTLRMLNESIAYHTGAMKRKDEDCGC